MTRRKPSDRSTRLAKPGRGARRPSIEAFEGRVLMSYGGSPELAYGTAGVANVFFGPGTSVVSTEAAQADGKVIVAGTLYGFGFPDAATPTYAVARVDANGQIDTTFGTGGVIPIFNSPSFVAAQADGKIVLLSGATAQRLNPDGSIDTTYGTNGTVSLAELSSSSGIVNLGLQPDGKIIAVQSVLSSNGGGQENIQILRFNADGSTDTSFGTSGVAATPFTASLLESGPAYDLLNRESLLIQPDGKIDLASGIGLFQVDADGSPDASFGTAGHAQISDPTGGADGYNEAITSIAIQADGKVVVAGYQNGIVAQTYTYQFFAARLATNGTPDTTFGGGTGVATVGLTGSNPGGNIIEFPPAPPVAATAVAIAPDGKIVIGGYQQYQAAIARLEPDGTPDPTFGRAGSTLIANTSGLTGVIVRPDGVILATVNGSIQALMPTGADGDYDGDGVSDPAIYLPSLGAFAYRPSGGGPDVLESFGIAGAGQTIPVPGYFDVSGRSELGVYLPALADFAYRPAGGGADVLTTFGIAGAGQTIPAVGYYDGTGKQDIAAYLPSLGVYAIRAYSKFGGDGTTDELISFGIAGAGQSIPVPGDYEGTGIDDIAVYLPSIGSYAIRPSAGGPDKIIPFGVAGMGQSIPMPGDYDGSGKTELAVYIPSQGIFAYRPADGGPDVVVQFGIAGAGQTLPMTGDYSGSGHTELGVYLPSLGLFAYRPGLPGAATGPDVVVPFGIGGAGGSVPFSGVPASNTLPATVSAASVSAESSSWIDVAPMATKAKKSAVDVASAEVPALG